VKRVSPRRIAARSIAIVLLLSFGSMASTVAADKLDFSGSYTLTKRIPSEKSNKNDVSTLRVHQDELAIEVTRIFNGQEFSNRFPLDGSEGKYVTENGLPGSCKGQFKSKSLILEWLVPTHPQSNGPVVLLHKKERWDLSSDSKTLKIHSEIDAPQYSKMLMGYQVIPPWTDIYTRQ
jgi:hypothetical protein